MDILILGLLLVRDAERLFGPGDLGGVKPRQVLELLVLARGHVVSTEAIAAALWSEGREPHNVTATLNTYVCVLRRSLFGTRDQARRTIVTGPGAYRLNLDGIALDVAQFDDLVLNAERTRDRSQRIRLLTEAVGLYRGPLLEHARYDEWVQDERQLYEDRVTRAHLDLARDWLSEDDRLTCLRHAELALTHDRYSEEAYRLIMVANYDLGHHDAVRRAIARCRSVLDRELGVGISPETSRLVACMQARMRTAELLEHVYPESGSRMSVLVEGSVA